MNLLTRAVPIATVAGAVAALLLAQLGLVKLTVAEQIVIALLALLAIDAFVERLGILRRIERHITLIKCRSGPTIQDGNSSARDPRRTRIDDRCASGFGDIAVSAAPGLLSAKTRTRGEDSHYPS